MLDEHLRCFIVDNQIEQSRPDEARILLATSGFISQMGRSIISPISAPNIQESLADVSSADRLACNIVPCGLGSQTRRIEVRCQKLAIKTPELCRPIPPASRFSVGALLARQEAPARLFPGGPSTPAGLRGVWCSGLGLPRSSAALPEVPPPAPQGREHRQHLRRQDRSLGRETADRARECRRRKQCQQVVIHWNSPARCLSRTRQSSRVRIHCESLRQRFATCLSCEVAFDRVFKISSADP